MDKIQMPRSDMLSRLARFKELEVSAQAFVDTRIPEYQRDIYNVIGRGVTEDADLAPAITDARKPARAQGFLSTTPP